MYSMLCRYIDVDDAKKELLQMAVAQNKEDNQGNVKFLLDVVSLLDTLWEKQNEGR